MMYLRSCYDALVIKNWLVSGNEVPRTFPYASGHGFRCIVPSASVVKVQVPSLYIASKIYTVLFNTLH